MDIDEDKIYKLKEAAILLCVSRSTLRAWDRENYFIAGRTRGAHRVYTGRQIKEMQQQMFERTKNE
ncbi:MAG: MerR family transcriptional regulator [Candidatus Nanoarchaeia archaeon]|nr:MerR family transcriptional regulator [Candidatus Nanoarchaeia archaeon]